MDEQSFSSVLWYISISRLVGFGPHRADSQRNYYILKYILFYNTHIVDIALIHIISKKKLYHMLQYNYENYNKNICYILNVVPLT